MIQFIIDLPLSGGNILMSSKFKCTYSIIVVLFNQVVQTKLMEIFLRLLLVKNYIFLKFSYTVTLASFGTFIGTSYPKIATNFKSL